MQPTHQALGPISASTNDETRGTPHAAGSEGQDQTQSIFWIDSNSVKKLATLTAKLALLGYALRELDDRSFLVGRWDCSRHLADQDAVAAFIQQIGGEA